MPSFQGVGSWSPEDFQIKLKAMQQIADRQQRTFESAANRAHQTALQSRAQQAAAQQQLNALKLDAARSGLRLDTETTGGVNIPFLGRVGGGSNMSFSEDPNSPVTRERSLKQELLQAETRRASAVADATPDELSIRNAMNRQRIAMGEEDLTSKRTMNESLPQRLQFQMETDRLRNEGLDIANTGGRQRNEAFPLELNANLGLRAAQQGSIEAGTEATTQNTAFEKAMQPLREENARLSNELQETRNELEDIKLQFAPESQEANLQMKEAMADQYSAVAARQNAIAERTTQDDVDEFSAAHASDIQKFVDSGELDESEIDSTVRMAYGIAKSPEGGEKAAPDFTDFQKALALRSQIGRPLRDRAAQLDLPAGEDGKTGSETNIGAHASELGLDPDLSNYIEDRDYTKILDVIDSFRRNSPDKFEAEANIQSFANKYSQPLAKKYREHSSLLKKYEAFMARSKFSTSEGELGLRSSLPKDIKEQKDRLAEIMKLAESLRISGKFKDIVKDRD